MTTASPRTTRRAALRRLADAVLEAPDLPALTRVLTHDLPEALGAESATLLLWDRRLESFQGVALTGDGRLTSFGSRTPVPEGPRARWMVSEGQLLETADGTGDGALVPLLARSGLVGTLVLGRAPRRRGPVSPAEAQAVSLIASRAALAIENNTYQKELIASERLAALGTMAGMLVHDFRGPMTVIRGYAETLLAPGLPHDEIAARAALIIDAVDRLERMTTETLDFTRGAERLVLRPVPVALLLLDLAAGVEEELPGLEVVQEVSLPRGLRMELDVDKVRRAISNIAANARDAMKGRGRMHLRARVERQDGHGGPTEVLVILLSDEGPGVLPEIRDRIFQPFVTGGKKRGTGLGLAVARRFVADHGGSLELCDETLVPDDAHPERRRRGACFRVVLPLHPAGDGKGAG